MRVEGGMDGLEDLFELSRSQQRGCATAEEDRMDRQAFRRGGRYKVNFAAKRFHISRDEGLLPGISIEVAIGTAMFTKGNVEVQRIVHGKW